MRSMTRFMLWSIRLGEFDIILSLFFLFGIFESLVSVDEMNNVHVGRY